MCICVAEDEIYDAIAVENEQLEILLESKTVETAKNYQETSGWKTPGVVGVNVNYIQSS